MIHMGCSVSFDIDGVLNNYPQYWIDYVNEEIGSDFQDKNEMKDTLNDEEYQRLKDRCRRSDYLGSVSVKPDMIDVLNQLSRLEIGISIVTSRPIDNTQRYPNLRSLTKEWLNDNKVPFDNFGMKRESFFTQQSIQYHIEDEIEDAFMIAQMHIDVLLINSYQSEVDHERIHTISDIGSISRRMVN